jgi:hypothetical protein
MVDQTVKIYDHLDVLIYDPGAIWWASGEHADEMIPAHAIRQFAWFIRLSPVFTAIFQGQWLERSDNRRQSSNILAVLPGQDSIRNDKGCDEGFDKGANDGLGKRRKEGYGDY